MVASALTSVVPLEQILIPGVLRYTRKAVGYLHNSLQIRILPYDINIVFSLTVWRLVCPSMADNVLKSAEEPWRDWPVVVAPLSSKNPELLRNADSIARAPRIFLKMPCRGFPTKKRRLIRPTSPNKSTSRFHPNLTLAKQPSRTGGRIEQTR